MRSRSDNGRTGGIDLRWDSIYTGEGIKRAVFAWLARTNMGVRSGSRPIGWVQMHNMAVLDLIEKKAAEVDGDLARVRVRAGEVYAGAKRLGSVNWFYDQADRAARR